MEATRAGVVGVSDREYLLNVLNEVLHGLAVDFGAQLHSSRENIAVVYRNLSEADHELVLSPDEALLVTEAAHLCESVFDEPEFGTRLGVPKQVAEQIVGRLAKRTVATEPKQAAAS